MRFVVLGIWGGEEEKLLTSDAEHLDLPKTRTFNSFSERSVAVKFSIFTSRAPSGTAITDRGYRN